MNQKELKQGLSNRIPTVSSMRDGDCEYVIVGNRLREYRRFNGQLYYTEYYLHNSDTKVFNKITANDIKLTDTVYEDLQVSISNIKLPASSSPEYEDYAFGVVSGVTYPVLAFALNEYMYFDVQSSHSMKLNTILDNHIHYTLPDTTDIGDNFNFQLDVIAAGINGQWSVPTGSPFTSQISVAANDDTYHRLLEIADIPAVNTTVSTIYKCKLTRIAVTSGDEYAGDVYVIFTDCHYQKNTIGSRTESVK